MTVGDIKKTIRAGYEILFGSESNKRSFKNQENDDVSLLDYTLPGDTFLSSPS